MDDVKANVVNLEKAASEINFFLNYDKSEIICIDELSKFNMLSFSAFIRVVDPAQATLLGSPIGGDESLNIVWESMVEQLQTLGSHLKQLQAYSAFSGMHWQY